MDILKYLLISGASFVVVLSVVVFVHEFGHFQAARWRKVAIDTFSIGFGKSIAAWRDRQGVMWKIGALPLGGYVKFTDDADGVSSGPKERIEDPALRAEARRKGLFHAQGLFTRSFVVAAGPIANFIFSIAAFGLLVMIVGRDMTDYEAVPARIAEVTAGSAAEAAGLRAGDVVLQVDGRSLTGWGGFQDIIKANPERPLALTVQGANGEARTLTVTPRAQDVVGEDGVSERVGSVGVRVLVLDADKTIVRIGPVEAIGAGAAQTWNVVATTGTYLGGMFAGKHNGGEIAGPLGIFNISGQVAQSALDEPDQTILEVIGTLALRLLHLAAYLSVAVGLVNLLPIPILDGGHLLFYAIEALRGGKPLPAAAQEWAFRAGLAVMASLFLFATWNDITRSLGLTG